MEPEIILLNITTWLKSEVRRLAQEEMRAYRLKNYKEANDAQQQRVAIASVLDRIDEEKKVVV